MTTGMGKAGAVVIGGYINGLSLVRSLAARGIPTAVITTKPFDLAQYSRLAAEHESVDGLEDDPERLVEILERRAPDWRGRTLFPANDEALETLARFHERLSSNYRLVAPPWEIACSFLDKAQMSNAASSAGLSMPHCYGPADRATAAGAGLRFPVLVKPDAGHRFFARFGVKLFAAADRAQLESCLGRIEGTGLACRLFDMVPGEDSQIFAYCTYVDRNGEPAPGLTIHKLRQNPPLFGSARVAEVCAGQPGLREATVELLRRIRFRGIAAAEFKLDPRDGVFRFLEVNGRSVMYNGLLRRAGLDLAGHAWSDYVGDTPRPAVPAGWPGVWINLHADLLYAVLPSHGRRVPFAELAAPYRRPIMESIWSAHDPRPFLVQWGRSARSAALNLSRGRRPVPEDWLRSARPPSGA